MQRADPYSDFLQLRCLLPSTSPVIFENEADTVSFVEGADKPPGVNSPGGREDGCARESIKLEPSEVRRFLQWRPKGTQPRSTGDGSGAHSVCLRLQVRCNGAAAAVSISALVVDRSMVRLEPLAWAVLALLP